MPIMIVLGNGGNRAGKGLAGVDAAAELRAKFLAGYGKSVGLTPVDESCASLRGNRGHGGQAVAMVETKALA